MGSSCPRSVWHPPFPPSSRSCTSHCFSLGRQRAQDHILLLNLAAPHLWKAPGCPWASCDQLWACAWNLKAEKFHCDFLKAFEQPSCSVLSPYIKITMFWRGHAECGLYRPHITTARGCWRGSDSHRAFTAGNPACPQWRQNWIMCLWEWMFK